GVLGDLLLQVLDRRRARRAMAEQMTVQEVAQAAVSRPDAEERKRPGEHEREQREHPFRRPPDAAEEQLLLYPLGAAADASALRARASRLLRALAPFCRSSRHSNSP